jgi:hypothetical protein
MRNFRSGLVAVVLIGGLTGLGGPVAAADTAFTLTATADSANARITADEQGFSVESADLAHGFLTKTRLARRLQTLGRHGVIRLGGYSMDLVWPAFGPYSGTEAPAWAIGGTVDQGDLDNLEELLKASGWKVTLGAPLKSVLDGSVTLDQVVSEVAAVRATLGNDLLAVELGNEYDHVTTLSAADYYATMKEYAAAIHARVPGAPLKMAGPSANTATTNTRLDEFVTAALADTSTRPAGLLGELDSHWYPTSHCGSSSTSVPVLMSAATYTKARTKLQGIMAIGARLNPGVPMVVNESNTTSCSGQAGVSNTYATALWSLDYLLQTAQTGVRRLNFHTSTAAICGDLKPRDSADYPISYRFYAAFCAPDQAALDAGKLSAAPLYYGLWAFRQVPHGRFLDLGLADADLGKLRAYGVADGGRSTMVLINVQDPMASDSTADVVTVRLPDAYRWGRQITLRSAAPGGLGSVDATGITLGGRTVSDRGIPSGRPVATPVPVDGTSATVTVPPGTAQIITFSR